MAKELKFGFSFAGTKNGLVVADSDNLTIDWTKSDHSAGVLHCTSHPQFFDVSPDTRPIGWSYFKNMDATATVRIGHMENEYGAFIPFIELKPGESCMVPLADDTDYAALTTSPGATDVSLSYEFLAR